MGRDGPGVRDAEFRVVEGPKPAFNSWGAPNRPFDEMTAEDYPPPPPIPDGPWWKRIRIGPSGWLIALMAAAAAGRGFPH
jgi:hypothetical protein